MCIRKLLTKVIVLTICLTTISYNAYAERFKDLATLQGVRQNQLVGYGLVFGLQGSGDQTTQTPFTTQSVINMLAQLGTTLPPTQSLQLKNVAAVIVTANLPPLAKAGQSIDVTISSIGNAKNLKGGTLVMTPLKGADGQVYAQAQGNLIGDTSTVKIPAGATVEREVPTEIKTNGSINYLMNKTDFTTTQRAVEVINREIGTNTARAIDGRLIQIMLPPNADNYIQTISRIENLDIQTLPGPAKIIINARTGTIVMNQRVAISSCAVTHGALSVTVGPAQEQQNNNLINIKEGTNLADVVKSINALGAKPADLISILQAMKTAGVLNAELEII